MTTSRCLGPCRPLIRCNIWHVRGRDRDLLIDTGLGMASLRRRRASVCKALTAVATHVHYDHVGGFHEFEDRIIHRAEAAKAAAGNTASLYGGEKEDALIESIRAAGYDVPPQLFTALPSNGYDPLTYHVLPAPATRVVDEGDVIDAGDRRFEVLHLPGHSPGSIGLWEAKTGILFSGDAIYDGPLLDELPGSDIPSCRDHEAVADLPVTWFMPDMIKLWPSFARCATHIWQAAPTGFLERGGLLCTHRLLVRTKGICQVPRFPTIKLAS
jgi:glyoxylase-like metal-dependent hydrolase (beta-lactamase superfamily II)